MKAARKTLTSFAVLMAATLSICSCDYVRATLGKPTSADLDAMRMRKAAKEKAVADSIANAQAEAAIIAALKATEDSLANARYFVIVGAFKDTLNVTKLSSKLKELGYTTTSFDLRSGLHAVALPGKEHLCDPALKDYSPWLLDTQKE